MKTGNSSNAFLLPEIHAVELKKGLTAYAVSCSELPLVSLSLVIPRGAEADPPGKAGLHDLAAEMLTLGTRKQSASQLARTLDGMGASLSAHAGWNFTSLQISGLSEDWPTLLALLSEVITQPAFSPEEFEQLKKRRIAALIQQKDESTILADERFQEILFRGTAYDHPVYGTLQSLPSLLYAEAQASYQESLLPEGSFAVLVGDIRPENYFRWMEENFPAVLRRSHPEGNGFSLPPLAGRRVALINRPELTQSQIRLGHIGLPHGHSDFIPFEVMNYILSSGGFSSRLMQRIRVELGYTYGIRGALEARKYPGPFVISTFTPTARTFACVQEIFEVIRSFVVHGATEQERQEAIQFLTGSYPMKFETIGQIAQRIIQAKVHGVDLDALRLYPQKVAAVSLPEIGRLAREHIHLGNMLLVGVGRAEEFRREFESLGLVSMLE